MVPRARHKFRFQKQNLNAAPRPKGNQSKQGTCCLMKSENIGSNKVTMNVIRKKKRVTMRFMVLLKVIVI